MEKTRVCRGLEARGKNWGVVFTLTSRTIGVGERTEGMCFVLLTGLGERRTASGEREWKEGREGKW